MSLYNSMNGVNNATFFILPVLGKHPEEYPRFRDCFFGELSRSETEKDQFGMPRLTRSEDKVISVYTRVGGNNRSDYQEQIKELQESPHYIKDYNDSFDSTFAIFVFSIPDKWKSDIDLLLAGEKPSKEYVNQMIKVFPKLESTFKQMI